MKNILFFGDSLTAGYKLTIPALGSFPALLQVKIKNAGLDYRVINAGISGDTTQGGLQRIDLLLEQKIDVFVLELGANDGLRGVSPAVTSQNLQAIINKVKRKHPLVKMVLLGMEIPAFIGGQHAAAFRSVFRKVATENNMAFMPFLLDGVAGLRDLNLNDGFHPSAKGYKIIADKVWEVIEPIL